ncbi:MAG: hypothetical protein EOP51_24550 [Sphingobacteriales bacterium]|nr:MAG: hypothetical protein EOP51_24550 [Sphingobacteriales bacterium]
MKQANAAVVIPFYKTSLSHNEMVSVQQGFKVLGGHPIIAIKPESLVLPTDVAAFPFTKVITFNDDYFKNIAGYNRLMLSAEFYEAFLDYEYMLIYQPDAFVFKDELQQWCNKDIDYVGPPWIGFTDNPGRLRRLKTTLQYYNYRYINLKKTGISSFDQLENRVGNGGFSLRRVKRFYELCTALAPRIAEYHRYQLNEDIFWSLEIKRNGHKFNIPNYKQALKFGFEVAPELALRLNKGQTPFGCHAWDINIDYWRHIFKEYGYEI